MKNELTKLLIELFTPRTIFASLFYGTFCWLLWREKPIPEELNTIVFSLLSFYFGFKAAAKRNENGGGESK
jgi:hypothetical protein